MHDGGFGVWKGTQHPELAWELVKYLSGPNGQRSIAATGLVMPALKSVARSSAFLDKQRPRSKGFLLDAVKYGHYQPFDTNYAEWSEMAGRAMDRVWTGDVPLEQALRKVTEEINAKFYNKPLR
jgi:multiple sugar transport system substrate-binding protein